MPIATLYTRGAARRAAVPAVLALGGLAALASSSGATAPVNGGSLAHASTAATGTTVTARHRSLGVILTTAGGRTLYLFLRDRHGRSACYGTCASVWSPLLTRGRPRARRGSGVRSRLLGVTRRRSGKLQVTYNHHPLYLFAGDSRAGDTTGEGIDEFGARWYVVSRSGHSVRPKPTSPAPTPYMAPGY